MGFNDENHEHYLHHYVNVTDVLIYYRYGTCLFKLVSHKFSQTVPMARFPGILHDHIL